MAREHEKRDSCSRKKQPSKTGSSRLKPATSHRISYPRSHRWINDAIVHARNQRLQSGLTQDASIRHIDPTPHRPNATSTQDHCALLYIQHGAACIHASRQLHVVIFATKVVASQLNLRCPPGIAIDDLSFFFCQREVLGGSVWAMAVWSRQQIHPLPIGPAATAQRLGRYKLGLWASRYRN